MPELDEQKEVARSPKRQGFVVTKDDITILKLIYEFRLLRRDQLSTLVKRHDKSVHRRLSKLLAGHYLTVIRLPQLKHIYALGSRALPVLVEQGIGTADLLSERIRTHELKELFLRHEMMLVDLHVMLVLASRDPASDLELVEWREGRELFDSVSFIDRGQVTLPVRPDALFTIEDRRRPAGANRLNYFLEADRGTAAQKRFSEKILAYRHYYEQQLHTKKYEFKSFRVLTVALTKLRADNLCRMTAALSTSVFPERLRKFFSFTSLDALQDGAQIFGSVYRSAQAPGELRPLIPEVQV